MVPFSKESGDDQLSQIYLGGIIIDLLEIHNKAQEFYSKWSKPTQYGSLKSLTLKKFWFLLLFLQKSRKTLALWISIGKDDLMDVSLLL